jgi:hypothetical protein
MVRRITHDVAAGTISQCSRVADGNQALKIHWMGTLLPKHRAGNPGGYT